MIIQMVAVEISDNEIVELRGTLHACLSAGREPPKKEKIWGQTQTPK